MRLLAFCNRECVSERYQLLISRTFELMAMYFGYKENEEGTDSHSLSIHSHNEGTLDWRSSKVSSLDGTPGTTFRELLIVTICNCGGADGTGHVCPLNVGWLAAAELGMQTDPARKRTIDQLPRPIPYLATLKLRRIVP